MNIATFRLLCTSIQLFIINDFIVNTAGTWSTCRFENIKLLKDFKVPIAAIKNGVCLQNTTKSHSYHVKIR